MQENHLKPNEEEFQDNSQDLINASLLFARALGLILKENEGIVVDVVGEIKLGEEVKKVIVFKFENQVHIYKCDEDIPEGNAVNMDTSATQQEQE
jgi:pheromone shutdown protein TraB